MYGSDREIMSEHVAALNNCSNGHEVKSQYDIETVVSSLGGIVAGETSAVSVSSLWDRMIVLRVAR
jgi:hypothetical protein